MTCIHYNRYNWQKRNEIGKHAFVRGWTLEEKSEALDVEDAQTLYN